MSAQNRSDTERRRRRPGGGPHGGLMMPIEKPKRGRQTVGRLWGYLRREKWLMAVVFMLVLVSAGAMLSGPYLIGVGIDRFIIPGDMPGLLMLAMAMIGLYLLGAGGMWLQNHIMVGMAQRTVRDIRKDLFDTIQDLPVRFFDTHTHGDTMSRLSNDVEHVANVLNNSVTQAFNSFITIFGTITMMLILSPVLTVMTLVTVPIMAVITKLVAVRTRHYFGEQQKHLGELNGLVEETISGQRVVKVFQQEDAMIEKFSEHNDDLRDSGVKAQIFAGVVGPTMNVINNLNFAIVAAAGGYLAIQDLITVGIIASFITYSRQLARPLNQLASQFNMVQSAVAGAERCFELMDEEKEPKDDDQAVELDDVQGEVRLVNVDFAYEPDVPVLKNVSLDVEPGETIALVGPTGAGKTTIINLLTRFYDIQSGSITIDGWDIRSIRRHSLRHALGIVLQDTYLFSDSVRENIRYGRLDASDEEVERAAEMAFADTFIRRLPHGYDTVLADDAGDLSQGQRQLLSIARAILADPAILILDEATSSVDTRTEVHIQRAMVELMKGRTCFVIAHRLSTIRDADRIVVINHGEIVEEGSHRELLEAGGFYSELYQSQFERAAS